MANLETNPDLNHSSQEFDESPREIARLKHEIRLINEAAKKHARTVGLPSGETANVNEQEVFKREQEIRNLERRPRENIDNAAQARITDIPVRIEKLIKPQLVDLTNDHIIPEVYPPVPPPPSLPTLTKLRTSLFTLQTAGKIPEDALSVFQEITHKILPAFHKKDPQKASDFVSYLEREIQGKRSKELKNLLTRERDWITGKYLSDKTSATINPPERLAPPLEIGKSSIMGFVRKTFSRVLSGLRSLRTAGVQISVDTQTKQVKQPEQVTTLEPEQDEQASKVVELTPALESTPVASEILPEPTPTPIAPAQPEIIPAIESAPEAADPAVSTEQSAVNSEVTPQSTTPTVTELEPAAETVVPEEASTPAETKQAAPVSTPISTATPKYSPRLDKEPTLKERIDKKLLSIRDSSLVNDLKRQEEWQDIYSKKLEQARSKVPPDSEAIKELEQEVVDYQTRITRIKNSMALVTEILDSGLVQPVLFQKITTNPRVLKALGDEALSPEALFQEINTNKNQKEKLGLDSFVSKLTSATID